MEEPPGGVGNDEAVTEQLSEGTDVRRLAAASASAGELKERLLEGGALHRVAVLAAVDVGAVEGQLANVLPGLLLVVDSGLSGGNHLERGRQALAGGDLVPRADRGADRAAGAVVGGEGDGEVGAGKRGRDLPILGRSGADGVRGVGCLVLGEREGADDGVGARR
eukprot:gnl/Ergobibamus_cyprinoides/1646.p1 GENE.gnl/Ergobibamus_cyprinoides/1646~~gnl/Ergobibamus_cyprinoides/1646.p1  ORF type:complete len:165 (+),score=23.43 gnl/Ergobibamus_cyprinoides/1646:308-802(+)